MGKRTNGGRLSVAGPIGAINNLKEKTKTLSRPRVAVTLGVSGAPAPLMGHRSLTGPPRTHTQTHTRTHTYTHARTHTHTHTHTHAQPHTHPHTHTRTLPDTHTHAHTTHTHTRTHTHTNTHTHTHTHGRSRPHTQRHTQPYTHTHFRTRTTTRTHTHTWAFSGYSVMSFLVIPRLDATLTLLSLSSPVSLLSSPFSHRQWIQHVSPPPMSLLLCPFLLLHAPSGSGSWRVVFGKDIPLPTAVLSGTVGRVMPLLCRGWVIQGYGLLR